MPTTSQLIFAALCRGEGMPEPVAEFRFHPVRRWRFDYAWPDAKVALEVEGGIWTGGRHTRGAGFVADLEKYNTATALGWRVLRTTPKGLRSTETLGDLKQVLALAQPAPGNSVHKLPTTPACSA